MEYGLAVNKVNIIYTLESIYNLINIFMLLKIIFNGYGQHYNKINKSKTNNLCMTKLLKKIKINKNKTCY